MIVELRMHERVLLRVNIWYLVLSVILKGHIRIPMDASWKEADLILCEPGPSGELRVLVPQPPEFKDDDE
jgi:hypothetical protein